MTKDEILKKVKEITSEQLGVDDSQITPEAKFVDDLGAPDEEAEKLTTVQKVVDYIEDHLEEE